mmetsp:Transcript_78274/g.143279  ORF Transcript_78274/g.143279 Transcript_78274/m.143279 type:complete len:206 (+) Transcript_78274:173-790(+)
MILSGCHLSKSPRKAECSASGPSASALVKTAVTSDSGLSLLAALPALAVAFSGQPPAPLLGPPWQLLLGGAERRRNCEVACDRVPPSSDCGLGFFCRKNLRTGPSASDCAPLCPRGVFCCKSFACRDRSSFSRASTSHHLWGTLEGEAARCAPRAGALAAAGHRWPRGCAAAGLRSQNMPFWPCRASQLPGSGGGSLAPEAGRSP